MNMSQEEGTSPGSAANPQPQSQTKVPFSVMMKSFLVMLRQLWARGEAAADEKVVVALRKAGVKEDRIPPLLVVIVSVRKAYQGRDELYWVDRFFVGGIGALNLIILQVLAGVGTSDVALHVSWVAFAISLPCTVGFLFLGIQCKDEKAKYNNLHSSLGMFAILTGLIATTALIWHFWWVAGLIFLVCGVSIIFLCLVYTTLLHFRKYFLLVVEAMTQTQRDLIGL